MKLSREDVQDTLLKWQVALFLRDRTIRVEVVREDWPKSGDIKIDFNNRLAILMVNETIAHEFLDESAAPPRR